MRRLQHTGKKTHSSRAGWMNGSWIGGTCKIWMEGMGWHNPHPTNNSRLTPTDYSDLVRLFTVQTRSLSLYLSVCLLLAVSLSSHAPGPLPRRESSITHEGQALQLRVTWPSLPTSHAPGLASTQSQPGWASSGGGWGSPSPSLSMPLASQPVGLHPKRTGVGA